MILSIFSLNNISWRIILKSKRLFEKDATYSKVQQSTRKWFYAQNDMLASSVLFMKNMSNQHSRERKEHWIEKKAWLPLFSKLSLEMLDKLYSIGETAKRICSHVSWNSLLVSVPPDVKDSTPLVQKPKKLEALVNGCTSLECHF